MSNLPDSTKKSSLKKRSNSIEHEDTNVQETIKEGTNAQIGDNEDIKSERKSSLEESRSSSVKSEDINVQQVSDNEDMFDSESGKNSSLEERVLRSNSIEETKTRLVDYEDIEIAEASNNEDTEVAEASGNEDTEIGEANGNEETAEAGGNGDTEIAEAGANENAETAVAGENVEMAEANGNINRNPIIFSDNNGSDVYDQEDPGGLDDDEEEEEEEEEEIEDDRSSQLDYVQLNYIERGDTPMEEKKIEESEIEKKRLIAHWLTVEELDDAITCLFEGFLPGIMKARLRQTLGDLLPYSLNIRKYGLRNDHFKNFFYLLNDRALYLGTVKKYLPFLLPRETISEQNIVKIIGRLSRNGDDLRTVNAFLKWTIVVFDYLDSTETIRKLYSVLFHYLGFSTTRASICHLLYFITRKEDVTPYRIRKLKSLVDQEKENRSLIGLLMVYNSFDKSVEVPVNVRLRDMFVFEHPDPAMKAELKQIKEYWGEKEQVRGMTKPRLRLPQKQSDVSGRKKKRSKETEEPHLDTISMMDLYNDLLHLQHSNQLQKILDDRKIQHLLVCNPNDDAIIRLSYYLGHQLLSTVRWNNNIDKPELQELLKKLLRLAQFSKSQLPIVNLFLREYLRSWNGIEFQDEILGLISFIKPADYEELYQNILLPLYRKYYVLDVTWKAKLINCYTGWLKNWALLDWRGHKEQEENETSDTDVDKITWMFEGLSLRVDYFVTIQRVIEHVDKISIVGLLAENDDPLLQHATLSFFELVANIPLQHDIPEIIVPSIDLVCRCFFSSNAMALSRICGIICQYVVAFSENDKKDDDWLSRHSPDYLTMFNTYVTDICNALWKNKSLTIGGNAMAFALSEENIENFTGICNTRGDDLGSFSSLTQSGSLTGFSKSFLNELENQQGKSIYHKEVVTAESLQQLQEQGGISIDYFEYRVKFLNYLTSKGLDGIQELLSSSMKSLIKYRRD